MTYGQLVLWKYGIFMQDSSIKLEKFKLVVGRLNVNNAVCHMIIIKDGSVYEEDHLPAVVAPAVRRIAQEPDIYIY